MFGDSFWLRQVGRTATKLSYVTQNSLRSTVYSTSLPVGAILNVIFFKSPYYVPPGIRWEDGDGQHLYFLPGFTHFVSRNKIALLLNRLKFEKTDNVFTSLSLLAQMVVEQEAEKLFS